MKDSKTLIIDGNNLLWRSFGRTTLTHEGMRTEAIYVGINMMQSYLKEFEPEQCIIVWDGGLDKRRTEKFPTYKRKKKELTPVEKSERKKIFSQGDLLKLCFEALSFSQCQCRGYEADDLIYNIILKSKKIDYAIVVSTDEDMYQLFTVKNNLIVYSPIKQKYITKNMVEEKFGFPIEYFATYKALAGDSSDNIPGVEGIGTVKAKRLIWLLQHDEEFHVDSGDGKLMSLFLDKQDDYDKMLDLVKFKLVDDDKLIQGWWESVPASKTVLHDNVTTVLQSFGFQKHLDNFVEFIAPFERYWNKVI